MIKGNAMKRFAPLAVGLALCSVLLGGASCGGKTETGGTAPATPDEDTLYQVSTLGALSQGIYDGEVDYATLEQQGDFGIGTFAGLDGEMVALDGKYYQVRTDGVPVPADGTQIAPFAMVTFFEENLGGQPPGGLDYRGLQDFISGLLPTPNFFYAVRVEGEFAYLKIRSVPPQEQPYPPLASAVAAQTVWELEKVRGTMVGFFFPDYAGSINQPGYHLHFLSEDLEHGGHVLDCLTGDVGVRLDVTDTLKINLPEIGEFFRADL